MKSSKIVGKKKYSGRKIKKTRKGKIKRSGHKKSKRVVRSKKSIKKYHGGEITKTQMDNAQNVPPNTYCEVMICKDFLLPIVCSGKLKDINYIFSGMNGGAFQFICENNSIMTLKILYEHAHKVHGSLLYQDPTWPEIKRNYNLDLENEFSEVERFDSPYIMKGFSYFIFDGQNNRFRIYDSVGGRPRTINIPHEKLETGKYRCQTFDSQSYLPYFGGLILEFIQFQFNELSKPEYRNNELLKLYFQYVTGLKTINDAGYIHNDIKGDNLMFNNDANGLTAKIIDLGTAYNVNLSTKSYTPASREMCNEEDIVKLQQLTQTPPSQSTRSRTKEVKDEINKITQSYDLYCLSKTFLTTYGDKINPIFKRILELASHEDYKRRLDNNGVLTHLSVLLGESGIKTRSRSTKAPLPLIQRLTSAVGFDRH